MNFNFHITEDNNACSDDDDEEEKASTISLLLASEKKELNSADVLDIISGCLDAYEGIIPRNPKGKIYDKEDYVKTYAGIKIFGMFEEHYGAEKCKEVVASFTTEAQLRNIVEKSKRRFPKHTAVRQRTEEAEAAGPSAAADPPKRTIAREKKTQRKVDEKEKAVRRIQFFTTPVYFSNGHCIRGVFS
jgi:hypothetical protein